MLTFVPCFHCGDNSYAKIKGRDVCKECYEEIRGGTIPVVTGPSSTTPAGRGGLDADQDNPWQSWWQTYNAVCIARPLLTTSLSPIARAPLWCDTQGQSCLVLRSLAHTTSRRNPTPKPAAHTRRVHRTCDCGFWPCAAARVKSG